MKAALTPARSSSCTPAMVVPAGDVTMSFRAPAGWLSAPVQEPQELVS
jgi:hypothetical protein